MTVLIDLHTGNSKYHTIFFWSSLLKKEAAILFL